MSLHSIKIRIPNDSDKISFLMVRKPKDKILIATFKMCAVCDKETITNDILFKFQQ